MGVVIFGLLIGLIASCGGGGTKTVSKTTTITEDDDGAYFTALSRRLSRT